METEKKKKEKLKKEKEEPSIVESTVEQLIPGLGNIVRTLEKSSPEFRKKIAETDAEIEHRLETGWDSKPKVNYGISIKPLASVGKPPEKEPIIDIFEEKDYISVIAELPGGVEEKDMDIKLMNNTLEISSKNRTKTITLPSVPDSIIDRTFKHGVLQLKIKRKQNAS